LPKKTTETIIESGNDYVIGVKGNQKKLMGQIRETTSDENNITSISTIIEKSKGRKETRTAFVSNNTSNISKGWSGLKSIIRIERTVTGKNIDRKETAYYISSLSSDAHGLNIGIRNHWGIENRLHYVKDVTFKEDESKINTGFAAENFSSIRNIAINIFRENGYEGMRQATRLLSNDIRKLKKMIE